MATAPYIPNNPEREKQFWTIETAGRKAWELYCHVARFPLLSFRRGIVELARIAFATGYRMRALEERK